MSGTIGRKAKIAESTDGITYNDIGKVLSVSIDGSDDIADCTTNDSNGYKEGEYADQQMTVDITVKLDTSNTGQQALLAEKFTNRNKIYLRFRPEEVSGERQFIALFLLDSVTIDTETGEVEEMNVTAQSTGAITYSAQP